MKFKEPLIRKTEATLEVTDMGKIRKFPYYEYKKDLFAFFEKDQKLFVTQRGCYSTCEIKGFKIIDERFENGRLSCALCKDFVETYFKSMINLENGDTIRKLMNFKV